MPLTELPVYLYDVVTDAGRTVVTCRTPAAAQDLAVRLNRMSAEGMLDPAATFTPAPPRVAIVALDLESSTLELRGYQIATGAVAASLKAESDRTKAQAAQDAADRANGLPPRVRGLGQ